MLIPLKLSFHQRLHPLECFASDGGPMGLRRWFIHLDVPLRVSMEVGGIQEPGLCIDVIFALIYCPHSHASVTDVSISGIV